MEQGDSYAVAKESQCCSGHMNRKQSIYKGKKIM